MGAEQHLLERWTFAEAEFDRNNPGANAEIMTVDQNVHIAYVPAEFAEHIVRLHNRTFGDGQDWTPPGQRPLPFANRPPFGQTYAEHQRRSQEAADLAHAKLEDQECDRLEREQARLGTAPEAVVSVSIDWEQLRPHVQRLIDQKERELLARVRYLRPTESERDPR